MGISNKQNYLRADEVKFEIKCVGIENFTYLSFLYHAWLFELLIRIESNKE